MCCGTADTGLETVCEGDGVTAVQIMRTLRVTGIASS